MTIERDASIFIDFLYQQGSIPDGYEAEYIVTRGDEERLRGALTNSGEAFELRLRSEDVSTLGEGEYTLKVAVYNEQSGYRDYIYNEKLKVV